MHVILRINLYSAIQTMFKIRSKTNIFWKYSFINVGHSKLSFYPNISNKAFKQKNKCFLIVGLSDSLSIGKYKITSNYHYCIVKLSLTPSPGWHISWWTRRIKCACVKIDLIMLKPINKAEEQILFVAVCGKKEMEEKTWQNTWRRFQEPLEMSPFTKCSQVHLSRSIILGSHPMREQGKERQKKNSSTWCTTHSVKLKISPTANQCISELLYYPQLF